MKILRQKEQEKLTLQIEGRLDTATSPQLQNELGELDGVRELELDFTSLEYISSAGLRILLTAHKKMEKQEGRLVIRGPTRASGRSLPSLVLRIFCMWSENAPFDELIHRLSVFCPAPVLSDIACQKVIYDGVENVDAVLRI